MEGFSDHHAVENYISQNVRGRLLTDGEKIKVDIGTLRTKVLVQEKKEKIVRIYVQDEFLVLKFIHLCIFDDWLNKIDLKSCSLTI